MVGSQYSFGRLTNYAGSGTAEKTVGAEIAGGAGDEDVFANAETRVGAGLHHFARGLIAGDERVAHPGKGWHPAGPEELLGSRGNAGMRDLDHQVFGARIGEGQRVQGEAPGGVQDDGEAFQLSPSHASPNPEGFEAHMSSVV